MKILAFDTANKNNDVAILQNGKILAKNSINDSASQAEMLIPLIEKSLTEAGIWYEDLDLIASTKGPGNFTGIRVGFSVAKIIKTVTEIPLITLNNLKVLAFDYVNDYEGKILVILDAKLEEFFIQNFEIKEKQLIEIDKEPKLIKQDEINDYLPKSEFLIIGDGKEIAKKLIKTQNFTISDQKDVIKSQNLANLAQISFKNKENMDDDILYVRKPNITKSK